MEHFRQRNMDGLDTAVLITVISELVEEVTFSLRDGNLWSRLQCQTGVRIAQLRTRRGTTQA